MQNRRTFLKHTGTMAVGSILVSSFNEQPKKIKNVGIQLYTVRKEMLEDATSTLKKIAALGFKQIESAGSNKGYYYGLKPIEMKNICTDLGMRLRSGHIHLDDKWQQTIDDALVAQQEYLICSTMPSTGQTVDNYKKVAAQFNKAGEDCKKVGLKFGYHNHDYEFEQDKGTVLYDVLMDNTDAALVHMELDLGWVVASGKDPLAYFKKYPGRFPLWHLKDMDKKKLQSTEFGKGMLSIQHMFMQARQSGMKYFFVEQEEYTNSPFESMRVNMDYLKKINA